MSRIRTNLITNRMANGAPTVSNGLVVSGVTTSTNVSVASSVTAGTFYGSGANLTGIDTDLVSDTSPQLGGNLDTNSHEISLDTSHAINFGDSNELKVFYHSGNGQIDFNGTTSLQLKTPANKYFQVINRDNGNNIIQCQAGGEAGLYHNGTKTAYTHNSGFNIKGNNTSDNTELQIFGNEGQAASILMSADDGDDNADHWRMYSNADNSFTLNSYAGGSYQSILKGTSSRSIELNYQGSKKLETTSAGIDISGNLTLPTTDAKIQLKDGNNYIQFVNADKNFKFMNAWGAGEFTFHVNGGERLRITSNGKVGINSTSPQQALDVKGSINGGTVNQPFLRFFDSHGDQRSTKHYFKCVRGSTTIFDIITVDLNQNFHQALIILHYGARLQAIADSVTYPVYKIIGVNRFNGGSIQFTKNTIVQDGNVSTHADIDAVAMSSTQYRIRLTYSGSTGGSSFCCGSVEIIGVGSGADGAFYSLAHSHGLVA